MEVPVAVLSEHVLNIGQVLQHLLTLFTFSCWTPVLPSWQPGSPQNEGQTTEETNLQAHGGLPPCYLPLIPPPDPWVPQTYGN